MEIKVRVEGLDKWNKYLKDLNPKIVRGMADAIKKSALTIEGASKINAPVDTGRLRASILTEVHSNYAEVMPTVDYAVYVHEGTKFMNSNPFMYDAVRQTEDEINDIFSSELEKAIQ